MNQVDGEIKKGITEDIFNELKNHPDLNVYGSNIKNTISNLVSTLENSLPPLSLQPDVKRLYCYVACLAYYCKPLADIKLIYNFRVENGGLLFYILSVLNYCYIKIKNTQNNIFIEFQNQISDHLVKMLRKTDTIVGPVNLTYLKNISLSDRYNIYLFGDKHTQESSCPSESDNRYFIYNYIFLTCLAYPDKKFEFYIEKDPKGTPNRDIYSFPDNYLTRCWKTFFSINILFNLSLYEVDYRMIKHSPNDYIPIFLMDMAKNQVGDYRNISFEFFKDINNVKKFFHDKFFISATKKGVVSSEFIDTIKNEYDSNLKEFYSMHVDLSDIVKNKKDARRWELFHKISKLMDYYTIMKILTDKPIGMELEDSILPVKNIFYYAGAFHTENILNTLLKLKFRSINYSSSNHPPNNMQCLSIKDFSKPFFSDPYISLEDLPKIFTATQKLAYFCGKYFNLPDFDIEKISFLTQMNYNYFYEIIQTCNVQSSQFEEKIERVKPSIIDSIFDSVAYYIGLLAQLQEINFNVDAMDIINSYDTLNTRQAKIIISILRKLLQELDTSKILYLSEVKSVGNTYIIGENNGSEEVPYMDTRENMNIQEFIKLLIFLSYPRIDNFYIDNVFADDFKICQLYIRKMTIKTIQDIISPTTITVNALNDLIKKNAVKNSILLVHPGAVKNIVKNIKNAQK